VKTPFSIGLLLAPLSAALFTLVVLVLSPAFSASPSRDVSSDEGRCIPEKGGSAAACTELVELVVHDVVPLTEAHAHAVVLTTPDKELVLPIFVDESAAVAIAFRLAHLSPPQPMAQDLLGAVVTELGGQVVEVRIDDLRDDVYFGRVFLQQGKRRLALDARPSDSIAMALDGQARILATRKVLDLAGISRAEIDALREGGPGVGGSGDPLLDTEPPAGHPPIFSPGGKGIDL
jgi:bifunctional DNase/RNase